MPRRNPNTFMTHTQVMTNAIAALRDTPMINHIGIWLSALATSAAITFFAYIIARAKKDKKKSKRKEKGSFLDLLPHHQKLAT